MENSGRLDHGVPGEALITTVAEPHKIRTCPKGRKDQLWTMRMMFFMLLFSNVCNQLAPFFKAAFRHS